MRGSPPVYAPAVHHLYGQGITLPAIAAEIRPTRSPKTISAYLNGRRTAPPELWEAIARLAGRDVADEARRLLAETPAP